ncbi:MAG: phosphoribosylamine--glycine ligase N-terminal domain-containing protein [Spirochaetia bacterium]|nr:phosphoribosylamine--glycine ligase N-terminal domain-containing protein [Spirochaetia bacterium]
MKVLILGSGAKAHALAWALEKSHLITGLYVAPGNSGTAETKI